MTNDPWGAPPQNDPWGGAPASNDPWGGTPTPPPAIPEHQMQAPDADEMFGGASVKGFSFDGAPPLRLGGLVTEKPESVQKRKYGTNEPMFWKDGRPRWQVRVLCQTDARVDDDDGIRAHYLEFKKMEAVKAALKRSGAKTVEQGSHLYLTYLAPEPVGDKAKEYSAEYYPPGVTPPAQSPVQPQAASAGWGAPPPLAASPGPPQQAQIAMQAGASPELARALCDGGLTVEEAQRLTSLAAGWQGASAEQILPYVRRPVSEQPPF